MKLKFAHKRLEWGSGHLELPLPILDAVLVGERIFVIFDYMAYPKDGPAPNLVAYTTSGEKLWTAENLTQGSATDAFVNFLSEDPLWVGNFMCYDCKVDPRTGKLLDRMFTK
jgi:hypothetical protein